MSKHFTYLLFTGAALIAPAIIAQTPSVLDVDIINTTAYVYDHADYARFATDPNLTPNLGAVRTFGQFLNFGDVTAVNGVPMKGTWVARIQVFRMATAPAANSSIGDSNRFGIAEFQLELLNLDGGAIGSIFMQGQNFGSASPGAPAVSNGGAFAVVGGTGAFLGVRGQMTTAPARSVGATRNASVSEDPSSRRVRGGGSQRLILQLLPDRSPEIVSAASGPQIFHGDFSPVTSASPARRGETLIAFATGLGVTRPALDAGGVFAQEPLAVVVAPVEVLVNGIAATVINRVGFPGTSDHYRIDFTIPPGATGGSAKVRLRAAWMAGREVILPVLP